MKIIKNIIIVAIFGAFIAFCLYIAPNYKKDENNGKTSLIINYTNVTSSMKGKLIIQDDGNIYISKKDIENYYDKYIYYDTQYNYIVATGSEKIACFDIANNSVDINGTQSEAKVLIENNDYYIPITKLQDVYNIKVDYKKENNTVVIESLDRKLEVAKVNKNVNVRRKRTFFSKNLEKLKAGTKVAIAPNQSNSEKVLIRTENGSLGYVKRSDLSDYVIERDNIQTENKKISFVWEYFSEYSTAPKVKNDQKYDGVNVVCPSFLYMNSSNVKENIGENGVNYINWAKSNQYEVWAMLSNNNTNTAELDSFSNWINDYKKRKEVIEQIVSYVKKYNFDGINLDYENIYLKDKNALSRFIIELEPKLKSEGAILSVDVTEPDGSENWSLCFDRNLIGNVADYVVFMAYDQYGIASKEAGPTAACYWVERNINKFLNQEEVPANKIILGIPFYTILWKENNGSVSGSNVLQRNIKIPADVQPTWLEDSLQYYMEYTKDNATYKMWIEDKQATSQKLDFIKKYNLAGAAFWSKGSEDESVWEIVKQKVLE